MVVSSGIYPYQYHQSSWEGSDTGNFRIPSGQEGLIAPSAIHFEEAMYVAKSEWLRISAKNSGTDGRKFFPPSWFTEDGVFTAKLNDNTSASFDPNPSGANLDGTLLLNYETDTSSFLGNGIPAEFQDEIYIAQLRGIIGDAFHDLGNGVGPWDDIFPDLEDEGDNIPRSGVKRDWLEIYKGYDDQYAHSGLWYLEDTVETESINIDNRMPEGAIYDRMLDEVRIQPIPTFSRNNGATTAQFFNSDAEFKLFGLQDKLTRWDRRPFRPVYLMTDGQLPTGWTSGLQINYFFDEFLASSPTGRGAHMIPGVQLSLSGNGIWTPLSGEYISDIANETRPDSPASCRFINLQPSGVGSIPTGQHRIMITNPGDQVSFPWGVSGMPHHGAIWPFTSTYEPDSGDQVSSAVRYWDITKENQSFWITDHTFLYRNNNKSNLGAQPHWNSGMYWLQLNEGPSNHTNLIDGWNIDGPRNSGMEMLYGGAKSLEQLADGANPTFGHIRGGGWAYDRSSDDYMVIGRSGLTGLSFGRSSGIYGFWDQQMNFQQGALFGVKTGAIRWHIYNCAFNVFDGTDWIINGGVASGNGLIQASAKGAWARVDTSFNLKDAILASGLVIGRPNYLLSRSEYITLDGHNSPDELTGKASGLYSVIVPTWGTLGADNATGSGTYLKTEHTITYATSMSGIINIEDGDAKERIHILKFFETEPDDDVYCTFVAFGTGRNTSTTQTPDFWIGKVDSSSHPFEITDAWMLHGAGRSISQLRSTNGLQTAHGDPTNCDHMEIHVNG